MFLVETISNIKEGKAAIAALKAAGKKCFISLTMSDDFLTICVLVNHWHMQLIAGHRGFG